VQLKGMESSVAELKLRSQKGKEQSLQSDIEIGKEGFEIRLDNVKPPCKISLVIDGEKEYQFWLFRYGNFHVQINDEESVEVYDSMENSEYDRISKGYHRMYLEPLEEKIKWVKETVEKDKLSDDDEVILFSYRNEIDKALKLRKKSVLSTFRKNPQNRIAIALMFDEYERLTSWQKEECLKTAQKYYSDCGINWQLRN
jgi:hypothetical protein